MPANGTFAFNVTETYVLPVHDPIPPGSVAKGLGEATGGWQSDTEGGWNGGSFGSRSDKEVGGPVEWEIWSHE